ncbi:hypothetical protein MMC11_005425 [Xylographa trunciseda]|nr:hypothetical protein [Xylographa trunciseda]
MRKIPLPSAGTCEWICNCPEFLRWLKEPNSRLLLLSAEPWSGKSVITRYLVETALPERCPDATIWPSCIACCEDAHCRKTRPADTPAVTVEQLIAKLHALAADSVDSTGKEIDSTNADTDNPKAGEIIYVLDGLDECRLDQLHVFTDKLKQSLSEPRNVRFLVTSRPHPSILNIFKQKFGSTYNHLSWYDKAVRIEMQADIVKAANLLFKNHNCTGYHEELRNALYLVERDQSSYLWTQVIFDVLKELSCDNFQMKQWKQLSSGLPKESLAICKKLLEPASIKGQQGLRPRFNSHGHPLYSTAKKLLLFHFKSVLGIQTRPRWKFEWNQQQRNLFAEKAYSADGPSLAVVCDKLYAVWRGHAGNNGIWWSRIESLQGEWTEPKQIPSATTMNRPAIAATGETLVALWKSLDRESLYYSVLKCGDKWGEPRRTEFGSKVGPALALRETESDGNCKIWAAWRGIEGDEHFWRASFDGDGWSGQHPEYIDVSTESRPALVFCHGRGYLAWTSTAVDTAQQIRISFLEAEADVWEPPFSIERHCRSNTAPCLARFKDIVLAAWTGKGNDTGIWLSSCDRLGDASHFDRPQRLEYAATDCTPAVIEYNDKLVLVWKGGLNGDCGLWWGYGVVK